jgi:hypothetical protein
MENAFIVGAVIGFTQLVKSAFDRDFRSVVIIVGAAAIGAIAGAFSIEGVSIATGILLGLSASGVVTGLQAVGGQKISSI